MEEGGTRWRRIPDPLVDDYLATLPSSVLNPAHDQLALLLDLAREGPVAVKTSTPADDSHPPRSDSNESTADSLRTPETQRTARALLAHLAAPPPPGVAAGAQEIRDAQECFYRFAGGLLLGVSPACGAREEEGVGLMRCDGRRFTSVSSAGSRREWRRRPKAHTPPSADSIDP